MCESTRGEWGKACPDCGVVLPARQGPLASWQAQRPGRWPNALTDRTWSDEERAARKATFARKLGIAEKAPLVRSMAIEDRVPGICSVIGCGQPVTVRRRDFGRTPSRCADHVFHRAMVPA